MIRWVRAGLLLAVTMLAAAADLRMSGWALKPGSVAKVEGLRLVAAAERSEATLATGAAAFSDVRLEKVEDITAFIPLQTVRWAGKGFR